MKKTILLALIVTLIICLPVGCGTNTTGEPSDGTALAPEENAEATTRLITDMVGREVEIPAKVERIVALGNAPRLITYLGLADQVVGYSGMDPDTLTPVTAYAYATKEMWADVPLVGTDAAGANNYYPEEIIRVNPDVILCTYPPELADEIQSRTGIPVVAVVMGTLFAEDYNESLRVLGEVCGVSERADEVVAFINDSLIDLNARTADVPDEDKPNVLGAAATFRGSHGIEGVYANYSILDVLNAKDVTIGFSDIVGGVLVDKEQILGWDPDYIFFDFTGLAMVREDFKNNPNFYKQLKAVQNGNLYQYPNATSYYSNLEIPIVNAYFIGSTLFPEQFKDVEFREKAGEIFEFFLGDKDFLSKLEAIGACYEAVSLEDI